MTPTSVTQNCPDCPHSRPVGCLPVPNIFHLANEFAKGKMFWNLEIPKNIELICNEIDTLNFPLPSKAFGIIPLHHSNSLQYYKEPNRLFFL